jgi:hypothetical protein
MFDQLPSYIVMAKCDTQTEATKKKSMPVSRHYRLNRCRRQEYDIELSLHLLAGG